jgi:hypothetical protein
VASDPRYEYIHAPGSMPMMDAVRYVPKETRERPNAQLTTLKGTSGDSLRRRINLNV